MVNPLTPSLQGRWTRLERPEPRHTEFIYQLALEQPDLVRWKYPQFVPRLEMFSEHLMDNTLSLLVVVDRRSSAPIGLVSTHQAHFQHGYAYVSASVVKALQGSGIGGEILPLYIRYVFMTWSLRKLYFYVPEFSMSLIQSVLNHGLKQEGTFRNYIFRDGRFWDCRILTIYRTEFEEAACSDTGSRDE